MKRSSARRTSSPHIQPVCFTQLSCCSIKGAENEAVGIADEMRDIDPKSPWLKLLDQEQEEKPEVNGLPSAPAAGALVRAAIRAAEDQPARARSLLEQAAHTVQHQAPFLIDFVDLLLERGLPRLAARLTAHPLLAQEQPQRPTRHGARGARHPPGP